MIRSLSFCLLLLGIDILSKVAAVAWIPPLEPGAYPFGGIDIFSLGGITFSLNLILNSGAAWGLFSGFSGLLFLFRILIIAVMIFFVPKKFPIWLILTGAIGNAIDFCLYGAVVDFLHFTFWESSFPIFNLADSLITIGAIALLIPDKKKQVYGSV